MGDPRGFLKVRTRRELAERPVEERIKDWFDVHAESGLQPWTTEQAARCMDCGTPFCMSGCPLGNIIPEFNDLVRQEKWEDAYNRLSETNNFPEVTGRICPALCEAACVLGIHQPPTMIKNDECTIIDQAWELDYVKPLPPQRLTDQTVAVVGSGPSGLACAQQLTRAGHTVVVYERDDAIGGLMRYGIPEFKMEKAVLNRRLKQMVLEGTQFKTGVSIGEDITGEELREQYEAVVLAIGATLPRDLPVPGRELGGIHQAMEFLPQANRAALGQEVPDQITATGKHVVIIGGGDTGADCLGTSIRQGAASVTQLEILDEEFASLYDHSPIHHIEYRIKTVDSIVEKLKRRGFEVTIDNIYAHIQDVAGVRVICNYLDDICYLRSLLARNENFKIIREVDYIQQPKESGYRSLHLICDVPIVISEGMLHLPVEIQLRTIAMDMWASLEHELRYKSQRDFSPDDAARLRLCSDAISEIDREMQDIYQGNEPQYHA